MPITRIVELLQRVQREERETVAGSKAQFVGPASEVVCDLTRFSLAPRIGKSGRCPSAEGCGHPHRPGNCRVSGCWMGHGGTRYTHSRSGWGERHSDRTNPCYRLGAGFRAVSRSSIIGDSG